MVLKLINGVRSAAPQFTFYNAAATTNTLAGGANTRVVNGTVTVVGFVGNGGTLTFNNVDGGATGGTKLLSFDYINADFVFSNTACSNCRNAFISVNGGTAVQAQMPISAQVSSRPHNYSFLFSICSQSSIHCHGWMLCFILHMFKSHSSRLDACCDAAWWISA
jgi:hypothetical protein